MDATVTISINMAGATMSGSHVNSGTVQTIVDEVIPAGVNNRAINFGVPYQTVAFVAFLATWDQASTGYVIMNTKNESGGTEATFTLANGKVYYLETIAARAHLVIGSDDITSLVVDVATQIDPDVDVRFQAFALAVE